MKTTVLMPVTSFECFEVDINGNRCGPECDHQDSYNRVISHCMLFDKSLELGLVTGYTYRCSECINLTRNKESKQKSKEG